MRDNYNIEVRTQILNILKENKVPCGWRRGWIAIEGPLIEYVMAPKVMSELSALPIKGICAKINRNTGYPFLAICY